MNNNITYWTWKWYEFSEKSTFYEKIKDKLEVVKLESQIYLSDAFILWGVEFDWLVVVWNTFYILNFKNWTWKISRDEHGNWKNNWEIIYNNKNPIEQCEQQQVALDQFLDSNRESNRCIKSIICFGSGAEIENNLLSYNKNGICICMLDNILDVINFSDFEWLVEEKILERMGLSKWEMIYKESVRNEARDTEFMEALNVSLKKNQIVQAGPGTGKTHFLIHKVVDKLIDVKVSTSKKWGVTINNSWKWVIAITFSKSAAESLEQRILAELNMKLNEMWLNTLFEMNDILWKVGTIHSFCNDMLRKLRYYDYLWYSKNPVIVDDYKLCQILETLWYDRKLEWMVWMVVNKYDWILSSFNEWELYFVGEEYECKWELIHEIFSKLRDFLIKNDYLTHDFSLLFTYEMLQNKDFFEKFKELWYTHILVDEFQDVSHIQFEIIKALGLYTTLVWDEHQAIYWFRGASSESFRWAEEEFKNIDKKYLTYNSRSWTKLVDKINVFLDNYKGLQWDMSKYELNAFNQYEWDFSIDAFDSIYSLDRAVADKIEDLVFNKGVKPSEIAILSRSRISDETRVIVNLLRSKWIICNYKSGNLIDDLFVREIFNFLDMVFNPNHVDMWQLAGIEKRLYGRESITKSIRWNGITTVKDLIKCITEQNLDPEKLLLKLLEWIISDTWDMTLGNLLFSYYDKIFLKHLNFSEKLNLWHYQLIISKLFTINEDVAKWDFSVFSETVQFTEFVENNKTWVQCMTIHWAKWLQWEYVFLLWMYKWTYPSPRAELIDELNVWYVWISRAKNCLYIPYAKLNKKFNVCELSDEIEILDDIEDTESLKPQLKASDLCFEWEILEVYWKDGKVRKFKILDEKTQKEINMQIKIFGKESVESIINEDSIKNHILEVGVDFEKENRILREENKRIRENLNDKIISQQSRISELINEVSVNENLVKDAEWQVKLAEKWKEEAEKNLKKAVEELEHAKNEGNDSLILKAEKKLEKAEKEKKESEEIASNRAKVILDLQLKIEDMSKVIDALKEWSDKVKTEAEEQIKNANIQKEEVEIKYKNALIQLEEAKEQWDKELILEAKEKLKNAEEMKHKMETEIDDKNKTILGLEEKVKELEAKMKKFEENQNGEWKWNYGHIFKAWQTQEIHEFIINKIRKANRSVMIIEPYIDWATFDLLSHRRIWVKWIIAYEKRKTLYSGEVGGNTNVLSELLSSKNDQEWNPIVVRTLANLHDRFLIVDDVVYQIWTSLNSTLWDKATTIQKLRNTKEEILEAHRE